MNVSKLQSFQSSVRRPPDFDRFWSQTIAATDAVPVNASFEHVPMRSTGKVDVFEVHYDSYEGLRIAAWYCAPKGKGPFPGMLVVPGYVSEPMIPKSLAALGYAALSAAPRGKLRSNSVFNPGYPGLLMHNITDRDSYGYRGFYMDAIRAFDVLESRPEVDKSRIGVQGSSQGGALTLLVAALRADRVEAASAGAPYLCSTMDAATMTHSYPYQEINDHLRLQPADQPKLKATWDYYDIHNFVSRIRGPIIVNIGLNDDVCPPATGFAVFREIGSKDKKLYPYEDCGHDAGTGAGHAAVVREFLAGKLEPAK
jgi:cephalosporin-C deacetylase